jgi:hypothetical protein
MKWDVHVIVIRAISHSCCEKWTENGNDNRQLVRWTAKFIASLSRACQNEIHWRLSVHSFLLYIETTSDASAWLWQDFMSECHSLAEVNCMVKQALLSLSHRNKGEVAFISLINCWWSWSVKIVSCFRNLVLSNWRCGSTLLIRDAPCEQIIVTSCRIDEPWLSGCHFFFCTSSDFDLSSIFVIPIGWC